MYHFDLRKKTKTFPTWWWRRRRLGRRRLHDGYSTRWPTWPWANMSPLNYQGIFTTSHATCVGGLTFKTSWWFLKLVSMWHPPKKKMAGKTSRPFFWRTARWSKMIPRWSLIFKAVWCWSWLRIFCASFGSSPHPRQAITHEYDEYGRMWFQDTPSDSVTLPKKQDVMPALKLMASGEMSIWHICPKRSSTNLHSICSCPAAITSTRTRFGQGFVERNALNASNLG